MITPTALRVLQGRRYELGRTDGATIDCSRLIWEVLRRLYPDAGLSQPEVVVADPARPWSCITHLDGRVGQAVEAPVPGRWHVCQGWDAPRYTRGHQWLWRPELTGELAEVWEATPVARSWHRMESPYWLSSWAQVRMVVLHG